MDIDHDYDPLQALGVRISTPAESGFLRANVRHIEKEHGTAVTADLVRALELDDPAAAQRFAAAICEDAEFSSAGERTYAWRIDALDVSGNTRLTGGTEAKALVAAAISAHSAALRVAAAPSP